MATINPCDYATGASATVLTGNGVGVTPTFQANPAIVTWSDQGAGFTAAAFNGYFVTAAATVTMPASPTGGDTIYIVADTTGAVVITGNTGQFIRLGTSISGAAGTCTSTNQGDGITLVYRSASTTWITLNSPTGAWVVV